MAVGDIKAGRAYVEIGTDNKELNAGLRNAQSKVSSFGAGVAAVAGGIAVLGAAAVAAGKQVADFLVAGLSAAVERGSQIVDIADRLGADVEGLQKIAFAAGRMGIEFESINTAIKKLQKNLGDGTISEQLQKLGIEADALVGLKADEAFFRVVDALRSVSDQNEQAALTTKLFGRAGADLQGIIKEGSASLEQMGREGVKLGAIMREDVARGFESAGDAWDDAKKSLEGLFNNSTAADWIRVHADMFSEFITDNEAMTQTFNGAEIRMEKNRAAAKQAKIDQENAAKFAEAQAKAAEELTRHNTETAAMMDREVGSLTTMVNLVNQIAEADEKRMKIREELLKQGRAIFQGTRTPEENAATDTAQAKMLFRQGIINQDTLARRLFQISKSLPQMMQQSTSAAGTFNPFAVQGLGDNERLTKAAEETAKNTKKLADNANKGMVFV